MKYFKKIILFLLPLFISGCIINDPYSAKNVFNDTKVVQLANAAKKGDTKKIDALLEAGVNIDSVGKDGLTPAYWGFLYVSPSAEAKLGFEHLIKKGANTMNIHEPSKLPLLHMAARGEDSTYLKSILTNAVNIDLNYIADDWIAPTPLANAMSARNFDNFVMLIEAGANLGHKSNGDESILEKSTSAGTWDYALYLLEQGADYNAGNEKTNWNLQGLPEIVRSLENLNYWDFSGTTSRDEVIDFLVSKGVELYPYHREEDPRFNPRPEGFLVENADPYFDFQSLLKQQSQETTDLYYKQYLAASNLLLYIKRENAKIDDFKTYNSKIKINTNQNFTDLLDNYAIDFFDANLNKTTRFSRQEIVNQLDSNKGAFRDNLVQLSYTYSQPFPQYSNTNFVITEDEKHLFIKIGSNYGLLFTNEDNPKLKRIESYEINDM